VAKSGQIDATIPQCSTGTFVVRVDFMSEFYTSWLIVNEKELYQYQYVKIKTIIEIESSN